MKDDESRSAWSIEIGLYPGFLLGARTYEEEDFNIHVLYLPFIDIALFVYK